MSRFDRLRYFSKFHKFQFSNIWKRISTEEISKVQYLKPLLVRISQCFVWGSTPPKVTVNLLLITFMSIGSILGTPGYQTYRLSALMPLLCGAKMTGPFA